MVNNYLSVVFAQILELNPFGAGRNSVFDFLRPLDNDNVFGVVPNILNAKVANFFPNILFQSIEVDVVKMRILAHENKGWRNNSAFKA